MNGNGGGNNSWHLDKRVPITLIFAIFVQTAGAGWWLSSLNERVITIEQSTQRMQENDNRVAVLRAEFSAFQQTVQSSLGRIERAIERLQERSPAANHQAIP